MPEPEPLRLVGGSYVVIGRRRFSYFSGCDYFRMSRHPEVLAAAKACMDDGGLSVSASRMTTGNHRVYRQLEGALAGFFGTETALLLPSGYMCAAAVAQAYASEITCAFIDECAHAALVDATRFLQCPVHTFGHRNPSSLHLQLRKAGSIPRLAVFTDGMFAADGAVAPLKQYLSLLPRTALLVVDDAHGGGVLGETGRGSPEYCGVASPRVIQTITLSKAFGCYGGAVVGSARLRARLVRSSRIFTGTTPIPLPMAAAAVEALRLLQEDPGFRMRLHRNAAMVKEGFRRPGTKSSETPGPIVSVDSGSPRRTRDLLRRFEQQGVYAPLIRYLNARPRFRFVISSEHTTAQLQALIRALRGGEDPTSCLRPSTGHSRSAA